MFIIHDDNNMKQNAPSEQHRRFDKSQCFPIASSTGNKCEYNPVRILTVPTRMHNMLPGSCAVTLWNYLYNAPYPLCFPNIFPSSFSMDLSETHITKMMASASNAAT